MDEYIKRISQSETSFGGKLKSIEIELTERCNNDCMHCCINLPAGDTAAKQREMGTEQIKGILQEAVDLGCLSVTFTGGEPLLRDVFEELYLHARQLGLSVSINTNARLITPHLAQLFAQIPPREPIYITVYGMHKESYEAVSRAAGSFASFWRGVGLLLENGVPFQVRSVILPPNQHEMEEFESWAKQLPGAEGHPPYAMILDLRQRRDNPQKNALIASLRLKPEQVVRVMERNGQRHQEFMDDYKTHLCMHGDRLFGCNPGCESLSIDAYGKIQPCLLMKSPLTEVDVNIGLAAALEEYQERLGSMRPSNELYQERCARCILHNLCDQCPAKSWMETGTLDSPVPYYCEIAHAQARALGWLGDDEYGWEGILRDGDAEG